MRIGVLRELKEGERRVALTPPGAGELRGRGHSLDGVLHYCVANMSGTVPRTSTRALTNATFPYVGRFAELGVGGAERGFARDISMQGGRLTHRGVRA